MQFFLTAYLRTTTGINWMLFSCSRPVYHMKSDCDDYFPYNVRLVGFHIKFDNMLKLQTYTKKLTEQVYTRSDKTF